MNLLTTSQAAVELGVTRQRIGDLIRRKKNPLPATKHGRDWLIKQSDLEKVRERKVGRPGKGTSK